MTPITLCRSSSCLRRRVEPARATERLRKRRDAGLTSCVKTARHCTCVRTISTLRKLHQAQHRRRHHGRAALTASSPDTATAQPGLRRPALPPSPMSGLATVPQSARSVVPVPCKDRSLQSVQCKSNNDLSRAQFVPSTPGNRGHSRLVMVSIFCFAC